MILLGLIAAIVSVGKCCQVIIRDDDYNYPEIVGMTVGACMEAVFTKAGTTIAMSFKYTCDGTNEYTGTGCSGNSTQEALDGTCVTIDNCFTAHMKIDLDNYNSTACTNPLLVHKFTSYMKYTMSFSNECRQINSTHSLKTVCTGGDVQGHMYDGTGCTGAISATRTMRDAFGDGGCVVITCGAAEMMVYSVFLVLAAMISFM
eukprot:547662_1